MAEQKTQQLVREYIIPLRNEWRKVANYRRAGRAIKEIKKFIARHMKVPERDVSKVKLDSFLNQEIWFRGRMKPPAKIKVRAIKEGDIVKVELAELPEHWKFVKDKKERKHKPAPKIEKTKKVTEEKSEEKMDEESGANAEREKEKSVAEARALDAKHQASAQKHTTKVKETGFHRMALKK